jgi:hypothetical protein
MNRLFFHEKVSQSFYNLEFYWDRRQDKKKTVLLYVLILAIFIGLISSIFTMRDFYGSVSDLKGFMASSIPDFQVLKGKMVIKGQIPTIPIIHDKDGLLLIFDPKGEAYNLYLTKVNAFYLSTDQLLIKNMNREQAFQFKDSTSLVYDKASLIKMADVLTSPLALFVGVLVVILLHVIFIYMGYFIHYTLGNIINTLMGYVVKPTEVMAITAYTLTVPAVLYLVFVMFYWNSSIILMIASAIANSIVLGGIKHTYKTT